MPRGETEHELEQYLAMTDAQLVEALAALWVVGYVLKAGRVHAGTPGAYTVYAVVHQEDGLEEGDLEPTATGAVRAACIRLRVNPEAPLDTRWAMGAAT